MIRLFITTYAEPNEARALEVNLCMNLNSQSFDQVNVLAEKQTQPTEVKGSNIVWSTIDGRPTLQDVIRWSNKVTDCYDITVLANSDITFERADLQLIDEHLGLKQCYCLNKYNVLADGTSKFYDVEYSQDSWVFRGTMDETIGNYHWGCPGTDNRFAAQLQQVGWECLNPSITIHSYHHHLSNVRTKTNTKKFRIPQPYLFLPPTPLTIKGKMGLAIPD